MAGKGHKNEYFHQILSMTRAQRHTEEVQEDVENQACRPPGHEREKHRVERFGRHGDYLDSLTVRANIRALSINFSFGEGLRSLLGGVYGR